MGFVTWSFDISWFQGKLMSTLRACPSLLCKACESIEPNLSKQQCSFRVFSPGLKKGDRVAIYMPMIIELTVAMLACARIGVIHSIVVRPYLFSDHFNCQISNFFCKILLTVYKKHYLVMKYFLNMSTTAITITTHLVYTNF